MSAWPDTTHLPAEAFTLPRRPTSSMMAVMRQTQEDLLMVGRTLERGGFSVPTHPRDRYAHAVLFLLPYAIAFGDDWWDRAREQLELMNPNGERS